MPPDIVVIAEATDEGANRLASEFEAEDRLLAHVRLGGHATETSLLISPTTFLLTQEAARLDPDSLQRARVVFLRRWLQDAGHLVRSGLTPAHHARFAVREWDAAFHAVLLRAERSMPHLMWTERPSQRVRETSRLFLLDLAVACGLKVPDWCVATAAAPVRRLQPPVVAKPLSVNEEISETEYYGTADVSGELWATLDDAHLGECPGFLQTKVDRAVELRVFYVLGDVHVVDMHVAADVADIRALPSENVTMAFGSCPREVEASIHKLAAHLEIGFFVLDFIFDGDSYHLVDVTPNGCWHHLAVDHDGGLSRRIARSTMVF